MTREKEIVLLIDELEDIRCNNFDTDTDEDKTLKEAIRVIKASKQEPCDDAISRQYLIDIATKDGAYDYVSTQEIANAPSVNPQPKTGHWIEDTNGTYTDNHDTWECSECGHAQILLEGTPKDNDYNYCPNCGTPMVEPQERSE